MKLKIVFVLFVLIQLGIGDDDFTCTHKLLERCRCGYTVYDYMRQYVVNCTLAGFTSTEVLRELPEEVEVLIFTGNHIPELQANLFGELSKLEKLRTIDMSNNGIRDILGKSYHHVANVELLILNHNELSIADDRHHARIFSNFINLLELHLTNAFEDNTDESLSNDLHDIFVNSHLVKLKKLHLEQNEIKSFRDHQVFCDLPHLMDLHLGDNQLTGINFNISCLKNLRFLDLERNLFTALHQSDFTRLDQIVNERAHNDPLVIDLTKNPFACSQAQSLVDWIHNTHVIVRNKESLTCHTDSNTDPILLLKKILTLTSSDQKPIPIIPILIYLLVLTLICALLITYWDKLTVRTRPLYNSLSRKVHYTTIEAQVEHV